MSGHGVATQTVECIDFYGGRITLPISRLQFRPAVYAITHRSRGDAREVLLVRIRKNGKWNLPGGGIDLGETMLGALERELKEETGGLPAVIGRYLGIKECFLYFNPGDEANHTLAHYFECRIAGDVDPDPSAGDADEGEPAWVSIDSLRSEDCHGIVHQVLEEYRSSGGLR